MEDLELLKAAIAVAVADGKLTRAERGVVEGLAVRAGVGKDTVKAMLEAAADDASFADDAMIRTKAKARTAVELLVAHARIDGEISDEERAAIIRIAESLDISGEEFHAAYTAGIRRADELRARRGTTA